jgi:transcriptional repressor NrdR
LRCPFCQAEDTKVIDSRSRRNGSVIRRRRQCEHCHSRFTTYEEFGELTLSVIKKDQRREKFNRQKIISGIQQACQKRPVSIDLIEQIASDIERKLLQNGEREIHSHKIGEQVMAQLQNLDQVAYVRFASVYREFRDIEEFMKELKTLLDNKTSRLSD